MAYLNAKNLSVRQMKRPLSHPIQVCTHNKSRSRLSILFIYFLSHVTSLMEGITFKKMGQHAPSYNQAASLWFIHFHKQLLCLIFIKENERPERFEAFKG